MNEFIDKMKQYLDRSVEVSKEAVKTAGAKVQDLGDKSVTFIEMKQLEAKIQEQIQKLGLRVYEICAGDMPSSVSTDDEVIKECFDEISRLNGEIEKRNSLLNKDKKNN